MYVLRPYQNQAVEIALDYFDRGKPFVIQMATGAGKSLVIADLCHKLNAPALILQPSKELLEQNHAKLVSYGVDDIAIYSASKNSKQIGKFTYATIGSIYKKPELFKHFKYVIIDECHLVNPKGFGMYKTFLTAIGCQKVCGLTATPYRIVQKYTTVDSQLYYTATLKVINRIYPFFFKSIPFRVETGELIEHGYLAPIKYHTASDIDLSQLKVNTTGADFTEQSLAEWADTRTKKIAATIEAVNGKPNRILVFCSSVSQANTVLAHVEGSRIDAKIVTGKTPAKERETSVKWFRTTQGAVLINVGVFTTGFDVPELDCIILARPTMSLGLYYQMVGRGVRLDANNPGKVLRVLDLAGVVERLGRVETIKMGKEDGFKDTIESEVGRMDETALFTFLVKKPCLNRKPCYENSENKLVAL